MPKATSPKLPDLPAWVTADGMTDAARRTAMLQFLLQHAALQCAPNLSMRHFSEMCGLAPSVLRVCGLRGTVSPQIADAVVERVGCGAVKRDWLLKPLEYVMK